MDALAERHGILVGVDGSEPSNAAVVWAAREAVLRHVPLTLIHMVTAAVPMYPEMPLSMGMGMWSDEDGHRVLQHAVKVAEDIIGTSRPVPVSTELKCSPPVPTLVRLSENAELMVVGSHGRSAVGRGLLGSVSSAVIRRANCPVAVIRDEDVRAGAPVVVGIDGSPASELATAIAFEEASRRGVELKAVHAWSDIEAVELPGLDWTIFKEDADRILAERLAGWQEQFPDVTVHRVVVCDRPARQLIKQAESAQLVVVGSHGRGSVGAMLLGSVSNAVVHSTRTPVIVARPVQTPSRRLTA
ncbi:universal stress protein [Mycobacterium sp. TY815]|uniref:universal stress protein n=1 Tax=Mycobacterium sp. TY815 TaxID=3050581 RepID=UPI00274157C9|nr:universal stress protein [Mycobacterium sp. TY815]MDP7701247.1 universal stress protein [Mycobacterium sp. TY815]